MIEEEEEREIIKKRKIKENIEENRNEKNKENIARNWNRPLNAQRNAKFSLKGKEKNIKLIIQKGDKFLIQRDKDDEIIYNDDYNYLKEREREKENEREKERLLREERLRREREEKLRRDRERQKELENKKIIEKNIIKEKEIIPRMQREIIAQIGRVKEDESEESSSQSEIDVLAGIRKRKKIIVSGERGLKNNVGYERKVMGGEVTFIPKSELGVNLGGLQYQKQITSNSGYNYQTLNNKMSGIEIKNSKNGEIIYEKMGGASGIIKEGNYRILKGNNSKSYKQLSTTTYHQTREINRNDRKEKVPHDSHSKKKEKEEKKQFVIYPKETKENISEIEEHKEFNRYFLNNFDNSNNENYKKQTILKSSTNIRPVPTSSVHEKSNKILIRKQEFYSTVESKKELK